MNIQPSGEAVEEAKKNPNGWVYIIDETMVIPHDRVPPEAIVGAWKVNENGELTKEFIANPKYTTKT